MEPVPARNDTAGPVPIPANGFRRDTTSSWGGSVLQSDDGHWWMWSAEMVDHCGIDSWTRNSRIVLASTASLAEPFQFERFGDWEPRRELHGCGDLREHVPAR